MPWLLGSACGSQARRSRTGQYQLCDALQVGASRLLADHSRLWQLLWKCLFPSASGPCSADEPEQCNEHILRGLVSVGPHGFMEPLSWLPRLLRARTGWTLCATKREQRKLRGMVPVGPQGLLAVHPDCGLCSGRVPSPVKPEGSEGTVPKPQNGSCVNWCRWVPHMSWHSTPDCLGCSGAPVRPDSHLSPSPASPVAECASWCQYMPGPSQQATPQCSGCSQAGGVAVRPAESPAVPAAPAAPAAAGCASWCQYVPSSSWQYSSGCTGCAYKTLPPV